MPGMADRLATLIVVLILLSVGFYFVSAVYAALVVGHISAWVFPLGTALVFLFLLRWFFPGLFRRIDRPQVVTFVTEDDKQRTYDEAKRLWAAGQQVQAVEILSSIPDFEPARSALEKIRGFK